MYSQIMGAAKINLKITRIQRIGWNWNLIAICVDFQGVHFILIVCATNINLLIIHGIIN